MKRTLPVLALAFALAGFLPARAQSVNPIDLSLDPAYPAPYSTVTVTPSSSVFDIASANVTIKANGAVVSQGSGQESAQVQVGGPGSRTTVTVDADLGGGQTYHTQAVITPEDVSLVTEPQSTTHPFYAGAPLIASEGQVRLVALADFHDANGAALSPSSLVYTWKHDDQILEAQSGIGKSVLVADAPPRYRDAAVTVTVATQDGSYVGQASTDISALDPVVRIYRNDPLLGPLFDQALGRSYTLPDSEETFRAVPYYFALAPSIGWQMNGTPSATGQDLTVRSNGSGAGSSVLDASASLPSHDQADDASLTVQFGGGHSLGIFGL